MRAGNRRVESNSVATFSFWRARGGGGKIPDDGVPISRGGEEVARVVGPAGAGGGKVSVCALAEGDGLLERPKVGERPKHVSLAVRQSQLRLSCTVPSQRP